MSEKPEPHIVTQCPNCNYLHAIADMTDLDEYHVSVLIRCERCHETTALTLPTQKDAPPLNIDMPELPLFNWDDSSEES